MLPTETYARRREALVRRVQAPILLVGNGRHARNLNLLALPFRQDSTFLYFTGCTVPDAALLLVGDEATLFLPERDPREVIWDGRDDTIASQGAALGFDRVRPLANLQAATAPHRGRLLSLAVPDPAWTQRASALTGLSLAWGTANGPDALVDAVITLRRTRDPAEIGRMRDAARVTALAHRAVMAATRPGLVERQLGALFDATLVAHGLVNSFPTIATVRGEVLHNEVAHGVLAEGQLFLLDAGAETQDGYCTDVTRTWPVNGRFTGRQRAAYEAVLAAQTAAISLLAPGVRYRDVHFAAALQIARFLVDEGLVDGPVDAVVESGAHALFFPHGVGHLIGLDAHDLEDFGDRATYGPGRQRSQQFGTAFLRIDLDLEPGMVVTVEPGFYVVPAILADAELLERFGGVLHLDRARSWEGFGGIRIEDDVAVTADGHDVITRGIPKAVEDLEAIVGTGDLRIPV